MNIEKEKALASFKWLDSQRLIFMICFFAGSIGVIVLRELNFGTVVAVAYAGLVMLAYVLFGATKKYLLRPDLLGDNTYYLGFLFTLVSLAYTLYRYTSSQNEVDQIIQNFGVALSTTLLGLVGRVYFNQTQEDPATYEKAVRMSLAEEASNLIGETAKIRTDVSVLRTSIQQTIEEGVKSSLEKLSESMKEITDSYRSEINKSSEKINESLESNLEGFTKSVAATNQAIENSGLLFSQAIRGFNQTSDELILEIKKLVSNVQKIDSIDDAIGNKILGPLNQFQSTVESVKISVDESKSAFIELTTNARQATDSLKLIGSSGIGDTTTHLENLNKKLSEAIEDISKTSKSFGELTTILVNSSEKMPLQLKTFEERYQEFNKRIQEASVESQESLLALQKSLILVANKVVEGVSKNG
jgi:biopolymer transport protein ExbB/TolQ